MTEIDVDHQINSVARTVGKRTIDAGEAHVVTIKQNYDTDQADLWDAVTNIERIPRWLMPISGDLEVGGSYQLHGNAGGTILTCDPPKSFTATWEYGGNTSWIEVHVRDQSADRAQLVIEHIAVVGDEISLQFGPGAVGIGWDSMVLGLALHLSTGEAVDPEFGEQWVATDEGRRFLALSNDAWYEANIASGADPIAAREAADRCLKTYYGEA
ncbi:polyketide cyclase [Mycobacterium sp. GA-1199]|uniref:SRPBCC domain-containing protein n=1 Tax=Mycobacterium sp. GA-1199 TaxID=1772287 RepID=UPI00074A5F58|nr:SRPBCC domain-containing protein [Mycobacterium sp. GA-1199]KUI43316.1 polyketide cyclase [Mycobacterium sp. GA-1199]